MEVALADVAETLVREFGGLRTDTVLRIMSECTDEFPYGGPHFIEQAARARLLRLRGQQCSPTRAGRDALDVSLHDNELADEVELTVRLMVAANESDDPLGQQQVDAILGVPPAWPVVPSQATARARRHYQSFRTRA